LTPGSALALVAALSVLLSACGGASSLPGGVYTSQKYNFSVTYPAGWQVNTSPQPSATAPLILLITRTGSTALPGSQISSLTINILDMSNPGIAKNADSMRANKNLKKTTVGGQPGYRDTPISQPGSASGANVAVIHSDYYVVHGAYFYTISTDALPGDSAALDQMAQSFTFLK
jgi:hypothetical protein